MDETANEILERLEKAQTELLALLKFYPPDNLQVILKRQQIKRLKFRYNQNKTQSEKLDETSS